MKKRKKGLVVFLTLFVALQFLVCNSKISAAVVNTSISAVDFSISKGKAKCGAVIIGNRGVNKIKGTLKLKKIANKKTTTIKTWSISVKTRTFSMTKNYSVGKGQYKLVLSVDVYKDGKAQHITMSKMKFSV